MANKCTSGDPGKTAEAFNGRGWSSLGDVGYLDGEGYLYLTDRISHMIISGGVNIYPQEVENLLTLHPDVVDVAVIGVPNPDMGEEVKAVVIPRDRSQVDDGLEQILMTYCRDNLAHYKCPRSLDFVDELPPHTHGQAVAAPVARSVRKRFLTSELRCLNVGPIDRASSGPRWRPVGASAAAAPKNRFGESWLLGRATSVFSEEVPLGRPDRIRAMVVAVGTPSPRSLAIAAGGPVGAVVENRRRGRIGTSVRWPHASVGSPEPVTTSRPCLPWKRPRPLHSLRDLVDQNPWRARQGTRQPPAGWRLLQPDDNGQPSGGILLLSESTSGCRPCR